MSAGLSNFSAKPSALDGGAKRLTKATAQDYNKKVLTARRTRAMREDAKYNSQKWEYTAQYLYDKFNGKLDDPNLANKGITGFTFSPDNVCRQRKMQDFQSGNIEFDTNKIIEEY